MWGARPALVFGHILPSRARGCGVDPTADKQLLPTTLPTTTTMPKTLNEEIIIAAVLEAWNNGASERKTCADFGVPRSTVQSRRATGNRLPSTSHQHQQRLSVDQETFLADWIVNSDANGYAPSPSQVRGMAHCILQACGDFAVLGRRWITNFKRRNPRVGTLTTRLAVYA